MEPVTSHLPPAPPGAPASDLEQLGERIAALSAQITAATYQLLALIRRFDEREGWNGAYSGGFRTCAHWLSWRTGLALGPAREKVRVARALGRLPRLSEAMRRGELSYSKIRALTRVATPGNEESLLEFARAGTASHVERLVRAWRRADRLEEAEHEARQYDAYRHASRYLNLWTDEDGMLVLRGRLDPEAGAALLEAVEAAADLLYDEESERETATQSGVPRAQRRADAIGRVAEAALAGGADGGLDRGTRGDRYQVVLHVDAPILEEAGEPDELGKPEAGSVPAGTSPLHTETPIRAASEASPGVPAGTSQSPAGHVAAVTPPSSRNIEIAAQSPLAARGNVPAGTFHEKDGESDSQRTTPRPPGPRVPDVKTAPVETPNVEAPNLETPNVEAPNLEAPSGKAPNPGLEGPAPPARRPPAHAAFENAGHVSADTARRIACDASKVVMTHHPNGRILDLGRKTRILSPALRRALAHRDQTCRFPGCGVTFCDAHHIRHWADGGPTRLDNLILLCRKHHRSVHEEGYRIQRRPGGRLRFLRPDGRPLPESPPLPPLPDDALAALADSLTEAGVDLERLPAYPEWDGSALDLAWAVDTLRPAGTAG